MYEKSTSVEMLLISFQKQFQNKVKRSESNADPRKHKAHRGNGKASVQGIEED